ncbi:hypothetical protein COCSUDRAFT_40961 [Coccomyxa subellipsoidea C-169]|uniref:Uncharacterized protein n=1 Tax=Coccomyxa subellipsoidea (strain C-169) TaxID=574566 RepID=I0Z1U1_COCSC|nr:hypothetical protein COCSUDRAFT_40961 [Coccomyxa subellipsoidea C-169]EIE24610.1 hypothetical protein COCSUDRAFT_40961 [Coccomyxa subellipsoidea C-169]|eukprot:XP_005649154.1 hypothetical protein COCSUDRAFT_40961 [Coccomyxa subellipsoidea C-169]
MAKEVKTQEPKVDDGAGGGNNGKNIFNGGGGDNDGGDDDDYFDNFDGGDGEGDDGNFFRTVIEQLYDRKSINAVLQEWFRTLESLPAILRGSVEMGLFSSAQLVRFLSMDVRPNVARAVTRSLPPQVARDIVGRLMADPAFVQKMCIEQMLTIGCNVSWEYQQRRERFWKEIDFVAINTLSLMAATGGLVWLMAPNRASGVLKAGWQRKLHDLPNHIFDASSPARRITAGQRAGSVVAKVFELGAVGTLAGAAMSGFGQLDVMARRHWDPSFTPSVPIPELRTSATGMALTMGVFANARYQMLGGIDRYLFDHSNFLLPYLGMSTAFRAVSTWFGQETRLHLQGLPVKPPTHVYKQRLGPGVVIREQLPPARPATSGTSAPRKAKKRATASKGFEMSATMAAAH